MNIFTFFLVFSLLIADALIFFVAGYDKPSAPKEIKRLQRWCNNRIIFKSCEKFEDYR